MEAVLSAIARGRAALDAHPLYAWMASADVPLAQRFVFAPLFANFILGFRDLNRWFLRYPQPRDVYEAAINAHTEEDETHSALFLEDWRELGMDAQLGWGVEDTMAWYYSAPETEVFRRYAMRLTRHVRRDARSARPLRDDGGHRDLRARLLRAHRPAGRRAVPAHRRGAALLRPVPPRSGRPAR